MGDRINRVTRSMGQQVVEHTKRSYAIAYIVLLAISAVLAAIAVNLITGH